MDQHKKVWLVKNFGPYYYTNLSKPYDRFTLG